MGLTRVHTSDHMSRRRTPMTRRGPCSSHQGTRATKVEHHVQREPTPTQQKSTKNGTYDSITDQGQPISTTKCRDAAHTPLTNTENKTKQQPQHTPGAATTTNYDTTNGASGVCAAATHDPAPRHPPTQPPLCLSILCSLSFPRCTQCLECCGPPRAPPHAGLRAMCDWPS